MTISRFYAGALAVFTGAMVWAVEVAAGEAVCRQKLVALVPEADLFDAPWSPGAKVGYRDGVLTVENIRKREVALRYVRLTEAGASESCIWASPAGFPQAEGKIAFSAVRAGMVTRYRIVLPYAAFGLADKAFAEGVGVALRTDDNDGEGRDLWMGSETPARLLWP